MERHPIPQNIMDVEFKLFGAFTVKQFALLAGGFILSLIIYFVEMPSLLKFIFIGISISTGIALALLKINGQSATTWFTNLLIAIFTSQERVWKKKAAVPEILAEGAVIKRPVDNDLIKIMHKERLQPIQQAPLKELSVEATKIENEENKLIQNIGERFDFFYKSLPDYENKQDEPASTMKTNVQQMKQIQNKNIIEKKDMKLAGEIQYMNPDSTALYSGKDKATTFTPLTNISPNRPLADTLINEQNIRIDKQIPNTKTVIEKNRLRGLVYTQDLKPIANANVKVIDIKGNLAKSAVTDSNGFFFIRDQLKLGNYYIDITHKDFKFQRFSIKVDGRVLPIYKFKSEI